MLLWARIQLRWSRNWEKRWDAAEKLGASGNGRAVKSLITALRDSKPTVRTSAQTALEKIGNGAVEPLIAALKDPDVDVRKRVAETLRGISDARAVEPFIAALKDSNDHVRREAARALGEIGDARAVEPLIIALKDSDEDVRCVAATALGAISDPRALELLIAALKDPDQRVRRRGASALEALRYEPVDETQQVMILVANEKWDDAVKLGAVAVEPLITALKGSCVCWCCEEAAGRSIIHDISQEKISECLHYKAAKALGEIGDARAVEPLIVALKDSNRHIWRVVQEALVNIGNVPVEPLIAALIDSDNYLRYRAAKTLEALGFKPADETQQAMVFIAYEEWENTVKLGSAAVEPLIVALKGSQRDVRWEAAKALGKIGDARAVKPLIATLISEYNDLEILGGTASIQRNQAHTILREKYHVLEKQVQILIELSRHESLGSVSFVKTKYELLAAFFESWHREILEERVRELERDRGRLVAYGDEQIFDSVSDSLDGARENLYRFQRLESSFRSIPVRTNT